MTLAEAGGATSRNRPGVYSGGWVASLCLDAEIHVATGDRTRLKPYAGEAYIRQDPTAAPAERARLADLLGLARSADVLHEPS